MKILSTKNNKEKDQSSTTSHSWITYLNPRNKTVSLNACVHCGVLKSMVSTNSNCRGVNSRLANMLALKGWIEHQIAS